MTDLVFEYYRWMYNLVCNDISRGPSFNNLMEHLLKIEFVPNMERDENRANDGINFRYRFGFENGYSREYIRDNLDYILGPCNVLEMMVSLSFKIEEHIMDDPDYGDRTGQWFWNMIVSLGLGSMDDRNFVENYVDDVIFRFINRDYEPNGQGSLFTLEHPARDLRYVEIWSQAMWYLDENFDFTV